MHARESYPALTPPVSLRHGTALAFILLTLTLAVELLAYTGLIASDDLGYAHFASQLASGTYRLVHHHYAIRFGVLLPVAALYRLFGVHEWTTVFTPLLYSCAAPLLTALLAFQITANLRSAWISGLLMASFAVNVRYASILVPEPLLVTVLLLSANVFVFAEKRNSASWAIVAGVLFGFSYLTKEPGIFAAAAFGSYALVRRQWRIAFCLALGFLFVIGSEVSWYWHQSGDPLFRLHAMSVHNASPEAVGANTDLKYRLLKLYPRMMLVPNEYFGLHSLVALIAAAFAIFFWRSAYKLLLVLWIVVPYLYLNFGTTSFAHYWALPTAPRYLNVIYPPLFVLASIGFVEWTESGAARKWIAYLILTAVAGVGIGCALKARHKGNRAEQVVRLKEIAAAARQGGYKICGFDGADAPEWRDALLIVAPEQFGCSKSFSAKLSPDARGLPAVRAFSPSTDQLLAANATARSREIPLVSQIGDQ